MEGEKPIALVDLDGTLCDYHNALQKWISEVFKSEHLDAEPRTDQIRERVETLIMSQPGWYRNLKPLPLGIAIYKTLRDIGFQIVICSKGSKWSKNSWTEKMEWVAEHLDEDVLVNITQMKSIVYGRVFVDDYPAHFLPWMERRPRGVVIVPDQPWNQEARNLDRVYRVKAMEDIKTIRPVLEKAYSR
jgi:hypothetical protein